MVCIVCNRKIKSGEQVFWGNQVEFRIVTLSCGSLEDNFSYSGAQEGLMGAIHLSCLNRPAGVVETLNAVVPEIVVEESVVQRSDALSIFDL